MALTQDGEVFTWGHNASGQVRRFELTPPLRGRVCVERITSWRISPVQSAEIVALRVFRAFMAVKMLKSLGKTCMRFTEVSYSVATTDTFSILGLYDNVFLSYTSFTLRTII